MLSLRAKNREIICLICRQKLHIDEYDQHVKDHLKYALYNAGLLSNDVTSKNTLLANMVAPDCPKCNSKMNIRKKNNNTNTHLRRFCCKSRKCRFQINSEVAYSLRLMQEAEPITSEVFSCLYIPVYRLLRIVHFKYDVSHKKKMSMIQGRGFWQQSTCIFLIFFNFSNFVFMLLSCTIHFIILDICSKYIYIFLI